jgi:hypothetical protein
MAGKGLSCDHTPQFEQGCRGLLPVLDVHEVPASKRAQAHLSIIPCLHQSHNSPAVGCEHEADCAHGSGAICCPELDLCGHVSTHSCT